MRANVKLFFFQARTKTKNYSVMVGTIQERGGTVHIL